MINLTDRIESFAYLGKLLSIFPDDYSIAELSTIKEAAIQSSIENGWFTFENITIALNSLGRMLREDHLQKWLQPYSALAEKQSSQKTIGVVMAGNIPLVGFHDFLCVAMNGNKILVKLSSNDSWLFPAIAELLILHNNLWSDQFFFTTGRLEKFDAIIATGNNKTAKYFEYYFGKYPHIIRHNRNSAAIIYGNETSETLEKIARDIMLYFGMGCRSITKIYVPVNYNFTPLINALDIYREVANHHKYRNNYDYNRTVFLINQISFIDAGYLLLTENHALSSRIAVLHYAYYLQIEDVISEINAFSSDIQCVVSDIPLDIGSVQPGEAQRPSLWDYSDNVDTMKFLLELLI
ncbi:MAG: acyl-CoA reductase [Bacteroidetes bacterium]|nr:acyl-CoA reductase [Bacteroidota bacterium]